MRWRIERLGVVSSTNDLALARARAGEPEGLVLVAEAQSRGRGRAGRVWSSPPGNLYLSLLLRPQKAAAGLASLSLLCGLVAAEAIAAVTAGELLVRLKWPNDLLVNGAKLGGILIEAEATTTGLAIVVGLGVNVHIAPALPDRQSVSLAALLATPPTAETLLVAFLERFAPAYGRWTEAGFAPFVASWLALAHGLGQPVSLHGGRLRLAGRFIGIDACGRLLLEEADGCCSAFEAGELIVETGLPPPFARCSPKREQVGGK